jgi:hypothetical protein
MGGRLSGLQFTASLNGANWGTFRAYGLQGSDLGTSGSELVTLRSAYQILLYATPPGYPLTPTTVFGNDSVFVCGAGTGGSGYATALTLDGVQIQTPAVANPCP